MAQQNKIRRYTAYFRGWAQAFGEHEGISDDSYDLYWLLGKDQIGLVLTPPIKRVLFRELLGKEGAPPVLSLGKDHIRVGDHSLNASVMDRRATGTIAELLDRAGDLHLYLTYHLFFESGTRILTLSKSAPLIIIYKEIEPFVIDVSLG